MGLWGTSVDYSTGRKFAACLGCALLFQNQAAGGEELKKLPICSAETVNETSELHGICEVETIEGDRKRVKINLTAHRGLIQVGGYTVETEHYNDSYLTPVVEANPGDTVAARVTNSLPLRSEPNCPHHTAHGRVCMNPTNLHYFHGGIVTPNNASPKPAETGNGDNIYVFIKNGYSFDLDVPIPGEGELSAAVLEKEGYIAHPEGLNWYHSHLHGISSDQVMGGMSGLLSVGDAKANVKAACEKIAPSDPGCSNPVSEDTAYLKDHTDVRYVMLRDIPLRNISADPEQANNATADWAPQDRDFPPGTKCGVWKPNDVSFDSDPIFDSTDTKLRRGFCQRGDDKKSAWLFTLNGQRYPTIRVSAGRNMLLRMGNVSANVAYWLDIYNEQDEKTKLNPILLSLDGVVPARPVDLPASEKPVEAFEVPDLLLMPASRAEIYIRNDTKIHPENHYILRAKSLNVGTDEWPEVQLARIELEANVKSNAVAVALNAPVALIPSAISIAGAAPTIERPVGCVRDLDPTKGEHRRVTFLPEVKLSEADPDWSVLTEIVHPPADSGSFSPEKQFEPDPGVTVGKIAADGQLHGIPFEDYALPDGTVDWSKNHVCVFIDHKASHQQLWVLVNKTEAMHNFHIHQMKFRLAKASELMAHKIDPPRFSHTCRTPEGSECNEPDQNFYIDDRFPGDASKHQMGAKLLWHDTIPLPPLKSVFLIMSFDATQQIGRFVYHCHILKHEDRGLMAPIEVWGAQ
jgi:FtsP/CotA-like multicopper oxidase with cupredoxin domain